MNMDLFNLNCPFSSSLRGTEGNMVDWLFRLGDGRVRPSAMAKDISIFLTWIEPPAWELIIEPMCDLVRQSSQPTLGHGLFVVSRNMKGVGMSESWCV